MTKVKNILRCHAMGMEIKSIISAFHISRNTVRKYVRRYQESGLSADRLLSMSEEHLQEMFFSGQPRGAISRHPAGRNWRRCCRTMQSV